MAVYHYFRNKEAVIHCVLQRSMASIDTQVAGTEPREDVTSLCHAFRAFALEHPQLFLLFTDNDPWLTAEYDLYEAFYDALLRMGLSDQETVQMTRLIFIYLEEFCYSEIEGWHDFGDQEEYLESLGDGAYPRLRALSQLTVTSFDSRDFEFGIQVLISGIEALLP